MSDGVTFSLSEAGVAEALEEVKKKNEELEAAIGHITKAFQDAATTNQLGWLRNMINDEWNTTGSIQVNNASTTLKNFASDLKESVGISDTVSNG